MGPAFSVFRAGILFVVLFAVSTGLSLSITKIAVTFAAQSQKDEARATARDWGTIISASRSQVQQAISVVEGIFASFSTRRNTALHSNCTRRLPVASYNTAFVAPMIEAIAGRVLYDPIISIAMLPGGLFFPDLLQVSTPQVSAVLTSTIRALYPQTSGNISDIAVAHSTAVQNAEEASPVLRGIALKLKPVYAAAPKPLLPSERCAAFSGFVGAGVNASKVWQRAATYLVTSHPDYDMAVRTSIGRVIAIRNRTSIATIVGDGVSVSADGEVSNIQTMYVYRHGGFTTFSLKAVSTCLFGSAIFGLVTVLVVTCAVAAGERVMIRRREAAARRIPRQAPFGVVATEIHNAKDAWTAAPRDMGEVLRRVNGELRQLAVDHGAFEAQLIADGALFVTQSPGAAVAFAAAIVRWSASTTWPASVTQVFGGPVSLRVAAHWCKDARVRSHARDPFKVDFSGSDIQLGAALRSAAPIAAPLITGNLCVVLGVRFPDAATVEVSPNAGTNPLAGQVTPFVRPGRLPHGPLADLRFLPIGTTPWQQSTVSGFVAVHKDVVARHRASLLDGDKTPAPTPTWLPPDSCLHGLLSSGEVQKLRTFWGSGEADRVAARSGLSEFAGNAAAVSEEALDKMLTDAVAMKDNFAADWLPARACSWPVAKAMLEAKDGYASQVPQSEQVVALTIATFFYRAYSIAFSPLEGSEQRSVFRRLQTVFGVAERRFLPHLSLRCGAICWQQLYGDRVEDQATAPSTVQPDVAGGSHSTTPRNTPRMTPSAASMSRRESRISRLSYSGADLAPAAVVTARR